MRVGFIGIGAMGLPMASNILSSGKKLFVFDIRDAPTQSLVEKGAVSCSSIDSLTQQSEIIMMSLPGPEEVRIVAVELRDGILAFLRLHFPAAAAFCSDWNVHCQ